MEFAWRSRTQPKQTAHAQATAAFYRPPQSAPEGGHGACAGYCRLLQTAAVSARRRRRRMRRLLPPFIGYRSQRQKKDTAHPQATAAFYRLPQSAPEGGHGACAGYCRLLQATAVSARRRTRRMRRLLPPLLSCHCQRQKEETTHAQAIAASFNLSHSALERTDGAYACRYRRLSQAVTVIAPRNKWRRLAQSEAARTAGVNACCCHLMKPGAVKGARCDGACAGYCTPSGFCCCSWTHE